MKKSFFKQFSDEFGVSGAVFAVLFILVLGGLGGVVLERLVLPYFSTWPIVRNFSALRPNSPILITKREEIRIVDGVNHAEVVNRAKNSLVTLYQHQGEFDSGSFRVEKTFGGVAVSNDGLILTPLANLKKGLLTTAVLGDGKAEDAVVLAEDPLTGLAILKINVEGVPVLREGFSENIKAGELLIAVRPEENPQLPVSMRVEAYRPGTVAPSIFETYTFAKLNAALSVAWPENSRVPGTILLNGEGELMGIDSVVSGEPLTVRGEDIKSLIGNYLDDFKVVWPALPIEYQVLGKQQTALFALPKDSGILVKSNYSALRVDDFVYEAGGVALSERESFQEILLSKPVGSRVKLRLIRDGIDMEAEVDL